MDARRLVAAVALTLALCACRTAPEPRGSEAAPGEAGTAHEAGAAGEAASDEAGAAGTALAAAPPLVVRPDLEATLRSGGFEGAFVAWEVDADRAICVGGLDRCQAALSPASTFKVPHALIGLELGELSGPAHRMDWDGKRRSKTIWNRDHTLASAIEHSVVWYFQRLAPRIGRARMAAWLARLSYGNQRVGPHIDSFWLDGSLTTTPVEQALFWHRLHEGSLPVSARARRQVLSMTERARQGSVVLRGKTGWYQNGRAPQHGWFTGCLDGPKRVCFATVLFYRPPYDFQTAAAARVATTRALLAELGYPVPE